MTTAQRKAALPARADVPREQTWDIEALFVTPQAWEAEAEVLPAAIDALSSHAGRLGSGPDAPRDYWDAPLTGRVALVLGAEHAGLPPEWRTSDLPVRIPMHGEADSLNVATAAALVLYEALRQRRPPSRQ